jgi:hypothetical protein
MKTLLSLCVVLMCAINVAISQGQPILSYQRGCIEIDGLPLSDPFSAAQISNDDWYSIFSVYTNQAYQKNIEQPIAGKYEWNGDELFFKPAYAFAAGETYHAVFRPTKFFERTGIKCELLCEKSEIAFSVPGVIHPNSTIESVFPESVVLPQNLLRMHIYFSAPMMPGNAYEHITLMREDGTKVQKAFLVLDQELWDADRKRFTLLFDPGRIKRDLKSNIDLGMALEEGEKYTLVIDSAWRDIHGNALSKNFSKTFFVSAAVRSKVSVQNWKVEAPRAGSLGNIVVSFDRPMDQVLAIKRVIVRNSLGVVSGSAEIINDSLWKFTPDHPWVKGDYVIVASPILEDVAGNNLMNAFDLDLSKERRVNSMDVVEIPLVISGVDP